MTEQSDSNAASNDFANEPLPPFIKAYIDEKLKESKRYNDNSESKSWKRSWRAASPLTKATLMLTTGVAVATIAYAIIAAYQLGEMRHTNELTREAISKSDLNSLTASQQFQVQLGHYDATLGQTKEIAKQTLAQAEHTDKLSQDTHDLATTAKEQSFTARLIAEEAKIQATNTGNLVTANQAASALDQRAWISIEIGQTSTILAGSPGVEPVIHNSGKTPALRYTVKCCELFTSKDFFAEIPDYDVLHDRKRTALDKSLDDEHARQIANIPAGPDRERYREMIERLEARARKDRMDFDIASSDNKQQVLAPGVTRSLGDWHLVNNENTYSFWVGKVVYSVTTDPTTRHTTKFCLYSIPKIPLKLCDTGQDMD